MANRRPGEGRYAHVEREQRWLVRQRPERAERSAVIVDRYVTGTRLRLRCIETDEGIVMKLGQKIRVDAADPEVVKITNIYLSTEEHSVLATLPAAELRKTRWRLGANGRWIAIDQFHGRLEGLVLAEVELDVGEHRIQLPPFAAADITNDDRFSGGALAFAADDEVAALLSDVRALISVR